MVRKMLEDLIRLFHERQTVEKIAQAEDHPKKYEEEKIAMRKKLEKFEEVAREMIAIHEMVEDDWGVVFNEDYVIRPEASLQIFLICMMTGINDDEMFKDYASLPKALMQVEGTLLETAKRMALFLSNEEDGECGRFSDYRIEELLKKFFD